MLGNPMVAIILQYTNVPNKHAHYKLTQSYMSIISSYIWYEESKNNGFLVKSKSKTEFNDLHAN